MIRQLTEIVQETRRLRDRCKSCLVRIHHCPPPATQWIITDSALQPFVTLLFTRLPWGMMGKMFDPFGQAVMVKAFDGVGDLRVENAPILSRCSPARSAASAAPTCGTNRTAGSNP